MVEARMVAALHPFKKSLSADLLDFMVCHSKKCHRPRTSSRSKETSRWNIIRVVSTKALACKLRARPLLAAAESRQEVLMHH